MTGAAGGVRRLLPRRGGGERGGAGPRRGRLRGAGRQAGAPRGSGPIQHFPILSRFSFERESSAQISEPALPRSAGSDITRPGPLTPSGARRRAGGAGSALPRCRGGPGGEGPQPPPARGGDIPLPTHPAPSGASAEAGGEEKGPALTGRARPGRPPAAPCSGSAPAALRPAAFPSCRSPPGNGPAAAGSFLGPAKRASAGAGPLSPELSLAVTAPCEPAALTLPKQPEASGVLPGAAGRGAGTHSAELPAPPTAAPSGRRSLGASWSSPRWWHQPQGTGLLPGDAREPTALLTRGCHPARTGLAAQAVLMIAAGTQVTLFVERAATY